MEKTKKVSLNLGKLRTLCDELVYGGDEFYCFYGDIEEVVLENEDRPDEEVIELSLTGTDEAFDNLEKYYDIKL